MPSLRGPLRQIAEGLSWVGKRLQPRAAVLMYHGIGDVDIDPWGLFVSPRNFAQHLQVLSDVASPVSLLDLGRACADRTLRSRTVAVTFDDGYANVLHRAKPLLERESVPATVFVVGQPVIDVAEYWWDALAGIILTPGDLPPTLELRSLADHGTGRPIELGTAVGYTVEQWQADHSYRDEDPHPSPRVVLYRRLWKLLLDLDDVARRSALTELSVWAGSDTAPRQSHRSVSLDELVKLDEGPLTVGGHTTTHPLLPDLAPDRQRDEIAGNKEFLETVLDRRVETFSYPFGANDASSVTAVKEAGYRLAVTTRPVTTTVGVDQHRIGRFDVKDWTGEEFERRLRRWMLLQ